MLSLYVWNHSVLQNGELSFPNGQNSISIYFFSQNPKCPFFLFQYTNVYLFTKFGDLKPSINEKRHPQIWTCFWARCRNNIPQGNCNFLLTKCLINVNWSLWSTVCAAEYLKPWVMLWDQHASKIWEKLNFWIDYARILVFSRQSHMMWS